MRRAFQSRFARRAAIALLAVATSIGITSAALADLRVDGEGRAQTLIRAQFLPEQQARYDLFARRCTKCHAMARPIAALTTGITPVTGGTFDEEGIRRYVVRMMRKPNSGLERADAREIILFLQYARARAQEPGAPAADARPMRRARRRAGRPAQ